MTEKEEKLLLIDLAARVPYGVMVEQTLFSSTLADKEQRLKSVQANNCVQLYWYKYINEFVPIHCIKPYLRPMSSMTDEEGKELEHIFCEIDAPCCVDTEYGCVNFAGGNDFIDTEMAEVYTDWLNSHHFDYRGLIEKGLAIEAPEDMYKTE